MKTCIEKAFVDITATKYYKYHGLIRPCNIQPDPECFLVYDTKDPYGPPITISKSAIEWKNREKSGLDYYVAHDSLTGSEYNRYCGQLRWDLGGGWADYWVGRMFAIWDTSSIPDDALVISAQIITTASNVKKDSAFSVTIRSGMPTFPHSPIVDGDFYYLNYTGDYGSTFVVGTGAFVINLNDLGLPLINKTGLTKFSLISDRDILRLIPYAPESFEFIEFEYGCQLKITYREKL